MRPQLLNCRTAIVTLDKNTVTSQQEGHGVNELDWGSLCVECDSWCLSGFSPDTLASPDNPKTCTWSTWQPEMARSNERECKWLFRNLATCPGRNLTLAQRKHLIGSSTPEWRNSGERKCEKFANILFIIEFRQENQATSLNMVSVNQSMFYIYLYSTVLQIQFTKKALQCQSI